MVTIWEQLRTWWITWRFLILFLGMETMSLLVCGFLTFGLFVFFCLMAYQSLWVIECQSHPCRRTVIILLTHNKRPKWEGWYIFKEISLKIAWLEFENTYCNVIVQHVSHYTARTLHICKYMYICFLFFDILTFMVYLMLKTSL